MTESDIELSEIPGTALVPARLTPRSIGGLRIRKASDSLPFLNSMIYGGSGVGKTLLAATASLVPELRPVLFIDVEGGTHTLSHFRDNPYLDIVPDPERSHPIRWEDLQKIYDDLYRGDLDYKTVVCDSLTEMQKLGLNSALGNTGRMTFEAEGNLPGFRDWFINTEQVRRMIRAFRDLPMNVIFTALADADVDPRTANSENPRIVWAPSFTKKLKQEIPAFVDCVFYMYSKARGPQNIRYLQTDRDNNCVAKCRVAGIPMTIESPTMEVLYEMLIRNPPAVGELDFLRAKPVGDAPGMMRRVTKKTMK